MNAIHHHLFTTIVILGFSVPAFARESNGLAPEIDCISGRGAGGQFILLLPELDLIAVVTSHNKGMGTTLATFPKRVLPAFINK